MFGHSYSAKNSFSLFDMQEAEYIFPYHHIPYFERDGAPQVTRDLQWGLEYLVYMKHVVDLVLAEQPSSVLDVGCGDGRLLKMLPEAIEKKVGCDLSEVAINMSRAFGPLIDFQCSPVSEIRDQFDVVTAIEVLEHVPDEEIFGFLQACISRVRLGGRFIITVPSTAMKLNAKHYRHYTKALLAEQVCCADPRLREVQLIEIVKSRDVIYKLFRIASLNNVVRLVWRPVRSMVWQHMWRNRIRGNDGLHILGVYERRP